eukprot:3224921-Amphidinium_carterae.1
MLLVDDGKRGAGTHDEKLLALLHSASIALPMSQRVSDKHQNLAAKRVKDGQTTLVESALQPERLSPWINTV